MVHPDFVSDPSRGHRPAQRPAPSPVASAVRPAAVRHPSRPPPEGTAIPPLPPAASPPRLQSDAPPPEDGWNESAPTVSHNRREEPALRVTAEMKADIRTAVRAAVEEAIAPLARAVQELAATLDRDRRERAERDGRTVALKQGPPPLPPSVAAAATAQVAPPAHVPPPPAVAPAAPAAAPAPIAAPALPVAAEPRAPSVIVAPAPAPRLELVIDASPYDIDLPPMFNGARRRKKLGLVVAMLLFALVGGMALMAVLSHNQPR